MTHTPERQSALSAWGIAASITNTELIYWQRRKGSQMNDRIYHEGPELHEVFGDVSREQVFESTDPDYLRSLHRSLFDLFDTVQSKIEAFTSAGIADPTWVSRAAGKVAFCKMAIRWVERRLAELCEDIPPTREGQDKATIRRLKDELREVRKELAREREGAQ